MERNGKHVGRKAVKAKLRVDIDDMSTKLDYEYRGLLASTWDLLRGDTSGWADRSFFLEVIKQNGQPVLDVGCGTGRLLLDYLGQGVDIDGVDNSPEMLALCRPKAQQLALRPQLYQQPMELLDLPRRYRTILVPSSSFQLLLDQTAAQEAMRQFYRHLQPGGVLVMPFMILWKDGDPVEDGWRIKAMKVRPGDGAIIRRQSRAWYDVQNQLEHTEDIFDIALDGIVVAHEYHRRSPATRWYTRDEAESLFRGAGFVEIVVYSAFTFEPAPAEIPLFTVLGRKRA